MPRSHGQGPHGPKGPRGHGGPRRKHHSRNRHDDGSWTVNARIERFVEPAVLLVLRDSASRDSASHGYDLGAEVEEITGDRVDNGNLYRLLRGLEEDGLVTSQWRNDLPGRSKRTYELTEEGNAVLTGWSMALNKVSRDIDAFNERFNETP